MIAEAVRALAHNVGYALLRWPRVTAEQRDAAHKNLMRFRCVCGRRKRAGFSVCAVCWRRLSGLERRRLAAVVKRGHVLAWDKLIRDGKLQTEEE